MGNAPILERDSEDFSMSERALKTTTLTGVDDGDLNRKQWEWQTTAAITIAKIWPDEPLPLPSTSEFGAKLLPQDQFSRQIDYYEKC
jgi:hypothetical protein